MTKYLVLSVVLIGLVASSGFAPTASAQQQGGPVAAPRGGEIAVIDIGYIFKNHPRFKADMAALQGDVERAETQMKKEQDAIRARLEEQKQFNSGTEEYRRLEEEVVRRKSDMAVTVDLQRKKFLKEEARVYHAIYQEIEQQVSEIAAARGIAIVLKHSADQPGPENPQTVLGSLNKQIVWTHRGLDITGDVMREVIRRSGGPVDGQPRVSDQRGAVRPRMPDNFQQR